MAFEDLEELLTGKALGISRERLDTQGWVAAFRAYKDARADEQRAMELSLVRAISKFDDWAFIADAIYLARSLKMKGQLIRAAIMDAEREAPKQYQDVIATEARRYVRDIPEPESEPRNEQDWQLMNTTEEGRGSELDLSARFGLNTGEGSVPRQIASVVA